MISLLTGHMMFAFCLMIINTSIMHCVELNCLTESVAMLLSKLLIKHCMCKKEANWEITPKQITTSAVEWLQILWMWW
jgi:hypothetical protein